MNVLRFCVQSTRRLATPQFQRILFQNSRIVGNGSRIISATVGTQRRCFSLESSVQAVVTTQTGIFQYLSESVPVGCMQGLLVNLHDLTGLPWWATIMCTTVLMRSLVTVPLAVYQQYIMAKVENLNAEMPNVVKEINKEMSVAIRLYNWDEKTAKHQFRRAVKKQWSQLIIRDNCHPVKGTLLMWFQIPLWISFSVALRNLVYELPKMDFDAKIVFRELSVGGFGWIPNLVEVDSSYILPITLGLINLAIIELQVLSKVNPPGKAQRYLTNVFRGFSVLMIPIAASVPSCLTLYWTTSSAYGFIQNLILMSPKMKRKCMIPQTPSQLEKPYSHVLDGLKQKFF